MVHSWPKHRVKSKLQRLRKGVPHTATISKTLTKVGNSHRTSRSTTAATGRVSSRCRAQTQVTTVLLMAGTSRIINCNVRRRSTIRINKACRPLGTTVMEPRIIRVPQLPPYWPPSRLTMHGERQKLHGVSSLGHLTCLRKSSTRWAKTCPAQPTLSKLTTQQHTTSKCTRQEGMPMVQLLWSTRLTWILWSRWFPATNKATTKLRRWMKWFRLHLSASRCDTKRSKTSNFTPFWMLLRQLSLLRKLKCRLHRLWAITIKKKKTAKMSRNRSNRVSRTYDSKKI